MSSLSTSTVVEHFHCKDPSSMDMDQGFFKGWQLDKWGRNQKNGALKKSLFSERCWMTCLGWVLVSATIFLQWEPTRRYKAAQGKCRVITYMTHWAFKFNWDMRIIFMQQRWVGATVYIENLTKYMLYNWKHFKTILTLHCDFLAMMLSTYVDILFFPSFSW